LKRKKPKKTEKRKCDRMNPQMLNCVHKKAYSLSRGFKPNACIPHFLR
jgi:hypothetical protein